MRLLRITGLFLLLMPLVFAQSIFADDYKYDDTPDVTARVSRISLITGDVQVKRAGSNEWEKAASNLPMVEGDQIATAPGARVEIQLDSQNYVRLAENSILTFITLRDGQIAVSLPEGTMTARVLSFDKDRNSFEVDAPQTTVAVQKAGMYRIDTGSKDSDEIRVTVTQDGQARVYNDSSGFTLKNGRTARIYLNGDYAGEPDINAAVRVADEWDSWVMERDSVVAKRLKDSYYDKYYDRDIFGAEDLNDYGEWVYTNKYGYVWRPYSNMTNAYSNWTPYRHGSWRWVPPYGWIWLGDEPWSWSTYHYGRWVHHGGYWAWTPYSQHRWRRSYWQPALVVITWNGSAIYWYPLPYDYYYYNYNSHYYWNTWGYNGGWYGNHGGHYGGNHGGNHGGNNGGNGPGGGNPGGGGGGAGPTPTPTPNPGVNGPGLVKGPKGPPLQPAGQLPDAYTKAVTKTDSDVFGVTRGQIKQAPIDVAGQVINTKNAGKQLELPVYSNTKASPDVRPAKPTQVAVRNPDVKQGGGIDGGIRTGVTVRQPGVKMDETLKNERVLGGRPPVEKQQPPTNPEPDNTGGVKSGTNRGTGGGERTTPGWGDGGVRGTGAVKRDDPPSNPPPSKDSGSDNGYDNTPVKPSRRTETPQNEPVRPAPRSEPRYDPPPSKPRETPRYDPPARSEPSKPRETPRYDPPSRSEPSKPSYNPPSRSEPSKPSSPPPSRSEPSKPSSPPPSERKGKG